MRIGWEGVFWAYPHINKYLTCQVNTQQTDKNSERTLTANKALFNPKRT